MNDIAPMPRRRGRPPKYPRPDTVYGLNTASGDNRGVTNYANSLPSYLGGGGPMPTQNGPAGGYAPRGYPTSTPSRSSGQPYPTRNAQGGYGQLQGTYPQMASSSQRDGPLPPYGQSSSNLPPGPPQPPVYYRPNSFPGGPLGFFLAPPGQASLDPLLSTSPSAQALYSTYGSRLRTGVTGLMQPETITGGPRERELFLAELDREVIAAKGGNSGASTPRPDSPAPPYSAKRPALQSTLSGRRTGRGGAISYVEKESEDEDEEDDEDDAEEDDDVEEAASDPEDADYGARGGRRRTDRVRSHDLLPGRGSVGVNETQASARAGKLKKRKDELDRGWTWLGDRAPGERVRSKAFKGTHHLYASVEALAEEADQPEHLVPVVIDFDVQSLNPEQPGIKLKDRFLWNINERFVTPKQFALTFCDDVGIPAHYAATIAELIQTQLDEARNLAAISVVDPDVTEDDVVWSEEEKEEESHIEEATTEIEGENEAEAMEVDGKVSAAATPQVEAEEEEAEEEQEDVYVHKVWPEADCRIVINLDVQIYAHILRDRIEWDLSSALPPSVFAKHYCSEIGLTGEAIPLVAHAIIDEILKHKKDALDLQLFRDSHPNEQAKHEKAPGAGPKTTSRTGAQPLLGVWRDWWEREDFGPVLIELSMEEMERREMERTREARRMMRTLAGSKRRR